MAETTRNSVLAIKEETTEGSPIKPTSGSDGYIALQDGFELTPEFNALENAELQAGTIGTAKTTLGLENPTSSVNHYMRHSAVEGQEPDFGLLIESAMGDKEVEGTEYDTVAGSTSSVVNVDTGEGAEYERGQGLLVKDGTNGYSVRNVLSVATDALTLGFNLDNAPAAGVDLGKAVLYKPGSSGPTFTEWLFRGNGGAIETIAGNRVTEMGIEITAGEFINGSFSTVGTQYYFDGILVTTGTNDALDFDDGGGEENATIAGGLYKDPHDLAAEVQSKLDALSSDTITCVYSDTTGKFTIASDGITFSLLWSSGTNTLTTIGADLGFTVSADDTGATSYVGDDAIDLSAYHTASYDSADPLVAKANQVLFGDAEDTTCFAANSVNITLSNTAADILSVCETSGKAGTVLTQRTVTIEVSALLERYQADYFHKFHNGSNVAFSYTAGTKTGTNWTAGSVFNAYMPTGTITSYALGDQDGLVTLDMTLTAYVDSGLGEFYLNFL